MLTNNDVVGAAASCVVADAGGVPASGNATNAGEMLASVEAGEADLQAEPTVLVGLCRKRRLLRHKRRPPDHRCVRQAIRAGVNVLIFWRVRLERSVVCVVRCALFSLMIALILGGRCVAGSACAVRCLIGRVARARRVT